MTPASSVLFFATGIEDANGGIASANRNISRSLQRLAQNTGSSLQCHVLHETHCRGPLYRAFSGSKAAFALTALLAASGARLAVFDHVRLALPVLALPRALRPPLVVCAHGSESWKRVRPGSIRVFRAASLVLANSGYTLRKMQERIGSFAGVACPLGLPPQFQLTAAPPDRHRASLILRATDGVERSVGPRAMLLVARMDASEREKGHRELIAVMPKICAAIEDAQLILVGDGSDRDALALLSAESAAAAQIFLPGRVSDGRLAELYNAAFAYVMPSRQEGFGLTYLEAMNYALPCIACAEDGGADVVVDGVTGLLVRQPIELDELARAIVELLSNPARARAMGVAGWRRLREEFSAEAHQNRIIQLLEPLLR